jgi:enoyl-CoA hydratase
MRAGIFQLLPAYSKPRGYSSFCDSALIRFNTVVFDRSEGINVSVRDSVLWVIICRPEKRNALSLGVLQALGDSFRAFAADESIQLAVVTGEGPLAFAAGGDLAELAAIKDYDAARRLSLHGKKALNAIRHFPMPVVAKVNGIALGGGAELALACDLRVAAEHATIGFIHGRLAITPSWGGSIDLMQVVGCSMGTRLLARAEILSSKDALALGIIDHVIPGEAAFDDAFADYVAVIARQPRQVLRAIKGTAIIHRSFGRPELEEHETEQFARTWIHDDHWTAVDALHRVRKGSHADR